MLNNYVEIRFQVILRIVALLSVLLTPLSFITGCDDHNDNNNGNSNEQPAPSEPTPPEPTPSPPPEPTPPPSKTTASASNQSTSTLCAEEDNVNIPITGDVKSFIIEATHPIYQVQSYSCTPNFSNCPPPEPGYPFTPGIFKLFDDGETIVEAVREKEWWRPNGMEVSVDDQTPMTDIHLIRIYRKIVDVNEWPQFFVLYMDGNLRLIPQPPVGVSSICYGSSLVVGPTPVSQRPIAEIKSVKYVSSSKTIEATYLFGGSATLDLNEVDRNIAIVKVSVNYPTNNPFTTFRSMFIEEGNADIDHLKWKDASETSHDDLIMVFLGGEGEEWFFYRNTPSHHNESGPDIFVGLK